MNYDHIVVKRQRIISPSNAYFTPSAPAGPTWDPNNVDTNIGLTGGNLIATVLTAASTVDGVLATGAGVARGANVKKYCEFTFGGTIGSGTSQVGAANSNWNETSSILATVNGSGNDCGVTDLDLSFVSGDVVGMAVHFRADDVIASWFRVNGGAWQNAGAGGTPNPETGADPMAWINAAAGTYWPAFSNNSNATRTCTANFGGSAYAQTAPSGYGNWA